MPVRKWKAPNKVAETMDPQYRSWTRAKRFERAERFVIEDGMSQAEAARKLGITRPRLNEHIQAKRRMVADRDRRSSEARDSDRIAQTPSVIAQESNDPSANDVEAVPGLTALMQTPTVLDPPQLWVANETRRIPPMHEFVDMYFRNVICTDCNVHHPLSPAHFDMMTHMTDPNVKRLLINVAPFHAKSQTCTVYHSIYELCRNPNTRIAIIGKTLRSAKRFVYQIGQFLTNSSWYDGGPNLVDDWGPFHNPQSWNQEEFWLIGRSGVDKDPSVSAYGSGSQIYSYRFDIMKFDDVADLKNQKNPEMVQDQFLWATQEAASRVGGGIGKLHFIGTRVRPGDIYKLLEGLPGYTVVRYPCITDEEAKTTIWQDHFTYQMAVDQRDSMGMAQFQLVYQNVELSGFGASFPPETLELCHDMDRTVGHYEGTWALVAGLDPAGSGAQAGYTALVLEGVDLVTGKRYLIDTVNSKSLKAPQLRDQIFDWADRYPLRELRVESNGLQGQLVQYNEEIQARMTNKGIRVVPHITTGHNKWSPEFGVESMAPMYYNRQVSVPWGDVNSRGRMSVLMDQLATFELGGTNDLVMAHWFAELGCRDTFQRSNIPAYDPRMKMPKRLLRQRQVVDFGTGEVRDPTSDELRPYGRSMYPPGESPDRRRLINMPGEVVAGKFERESAGVGG